MQTQQEIENKIKEVKPYLQDEFGVDQIGYFGSFANGNYRIDSDLDVLVSFNKKIGWKFFDLKDYLESLIGRKVDLVTERSLTCWGAFAIIRVNLSRKLLKIGSSLLIFPLQNVMLTAGKHLFTFWKSCLLTSG